MMVAGPPETRRIDGTLVALRDTVLNTVDLDSFGAGLNVAVIGAGGGIGQALLELLSLHETVDRVNAFSRSPLNVGETKAAWTPIDIENEDSIESAATKLCALDGGGTSRNRRHRNPP